jgi:uncharacterized protein (TIGR00251 family)
MIALEDHPSGVILPVRVRAGARRSAIQGHHDGALKVAVTTAPEKGKANRAVIALLCQELDLKRTQITLISGATSPRKRLLVSAIERDELARRLGRLIDAASNG